MIIFGFKVNPSIRLGSGVNGSKDVKNHPWFAGVKWVELYRRNVVAPVKRNSFSGSNYSGNIVQPKVNKVAALEKSLLGIGRASGRRPRQADNSIQNRRRLEKLLNIR